MLPFFVIKKVPPLNKKIRKLYMDRADQIVGKIGPFIKNGDRVLDVGCGTGSIAKIIKKTRTANVTLVDVQQNPICDQFPIIIYDGKNLPFENGEFSVSLLTAVLHHTENPDKVLDEVTRVTSGRIIIMEDVFTDFLGRMVTFIGDCIINWEIHSPFRNKTTAQWKKVFENKNLKVLHQEEFKLRVVGFPFELAIFVLEKKTNVKN